MTRIIASSLVCGIGIFAIGCQTASEGDRHADWHPRHAPRAENEQANVHIPADEDLTRSLRVAVVYNDTHIQIRYAFATDHPSWYHDYLVYEQGQWQRLGEGAAGPAPTGLQEDRIALMLDDGSVDGFAEYGGYVTMHPGVSSRSDEAPEGINKFIPTSREGETDAGMWQRIRSEDDLDRLRDEGVFINTWQWRAHRSNPIGYADPGYVLDARNAAEGRGMYATNWNGDLDQPRFMFDPAHSDRHALCREELLARAYGQDDPYYLVEDGALPFDAEHDWQEGDVLPRRYLREPSGSRASLAADGRWADGEWRVRVTRTLEAPNPRDSKTLEAGETYNFAFAVHADATQARWHYVSMPLTLGLGADADVPAQYVEGDLDSTEVDQWFEVPLFYSGQVYLAWLHDNGHPVHLQFSEAQMNPLDASTIEALAGQLAEHEQRWLREQGIDLESR